MRTKSTALRALLALPLLIPSSPLSISGRPVTRESTTTRASASAALLRDRICPPPPPSLNLHLPSLPLTTARVGPRFAANKPAVDAAANPLFSFLLRRKLETLCDAQDLQCHVSARGVVGDGLSEVGLRCSAITFPGLPISGGMSLRASGKGLFWRLLRDEPCEAELDATFLAQDIKNSALLQSLTANLIDK